MLQFLKQMLQLTVNPERGWEDISHEGADPMKLRRQGLYPILALTALSCAGEFMKVGSFATVTGVVSDAVIKLTIYFATLLFADFMMSTFMPKLTEREPSAKKDTTFVTYIIALLAVIDIVINLVPIDFPVLWFLDIYVGVIMYKGIRYLSVSPEHEGHFMFMTVFSIIVPPMLLSFLLT